jgi:hypothetical protein
MKAEAARIVEIASVKSFDLASDEEINARLRGKLFKEAPWNDGQTSDSDKPKMVPLPTEESSRGINLFFSQPIGKKPFKT